METKKLANRRKKERHKGVMDPMTWCTLCKFACFKINSKGT